METWKDVPGLEGKYQVSNTGKVKTLLQSSRRELKCSRNNNGYLQLSAQGRRFLVHRLVALAFIPNPKNLPVVNHIDSDPQNNSVSNLEWTTQSDNSLHGVKCGKVKKGSDSYRATITEAEVDQVLALTGMPPGRIARKLGLSYSVVHKIINGEAWNHYTGIPRARYLRKIGSLSATPLTIDFKR